MRIVWDEPKRLANLEKHGLDFAEFDLAFFEAAEIRPARVGRWRAAGWKGRDPVIVIFASLGREAISIISARPASRSERREME